MARVINRHSQGVKTIRPGVTRRAINIMTPARLKSFSLKDYLKWTVYRHDNALAFDQECIKEHFRFDFVCQ